MGQVGLARLAQLALMDLRRIDVGLVERVYVGIVVPTLDFVEDVVESDFQARIQPDWKGLLEYGSFGQGFHNLARDTYAAFGLVLQQDPADCYFTQGGDDFLVLAGHDFLGTVVNRAGALAGGHYELETVCDVIQTIFNRYACHEKASKREVGPSIIANSLGLYRTPQTQ